MCAIYRGRIVCGVATVCACWDGAQLAFSSDTVLYCWRRLRNSLLLLAFLAAAIPASAAVLGLRVATCRIDMSDLCLSLADPTRATCPTHGKSSQIRASKRTIRIILPGTAFAGRARARLTRRDTDTKAHALSALDGWCRGWWRRAQALRAGRKPRPLVALHRSRC